MRVYVSKSYVLGLTVEGNVDGIWIGVGSFSRLLRCRGRLILCSRRLMVRGSLLARLNNLHRPEGLLRPGLYCVEYSQEHASTSPGQHQLEPDNKHPVKNAGHSGDPGDGHENIGRLAPILFQHIETV